MLRMNMQMLMLGMLWSFDKCKYMNVWNECWEMLGSFDRCKYMNV